MEITCGNKKCTKKVSAFEQLYVGNLRVCQDCSDKFQQGDYCPSCQIFLDAPNSCSCKSHHVSSEQSSSTNFALNDAPEASSFSRPIRKSKQAAMDAVFAMRLQQKEPMYAFSVAKDKSKSSSAHAAAASSSSGAAAAVASSSASASNQSVFNMNNDHAAGNGASADVAKKKEKRPYHFHSIPIKGGIKKNKTIVASKRFPTEPPVSAASPAKKPNSWKKIASRGQHGNAKKSAILLPHSKVKAATRAPPPSLSKSITINPRVEFLLLASTESPTIDTLVTHMAVPKEATVLALQRLIAEVGGLTCDLSEIQISCRGLSMSGTHSLGNIQKHIWPQNTGLLVLRYCVPPNSVAAPVELDESLNEDALNGLVGIASEATA